MKKLLSLALLGSLALGSIGCNCAIERKAIEDLRATHEIIFPEYLRLMRKEYGQDKEKVENREKLVGSAVRIVEGLEKVVK